MQWVASTLNCNETASPSKRNYRQLEMWTKQRKVGQRERGTTEGRHHHHCNRDQRHFNTLLLGSLMGRLFLVLHIQISLVRYRCFMGIYFSWFSSSMDRALQLLQLLSHTPYWQLDYGYYAIWSRLMQLICTKEDPLWEHFETYFYSYQTSSK